MTGDAPPNEWMDDAHIQTFLRRLNAQIADDHTGVRQRNAERSRIAGLSPAMAISGLLGHAEPETEGEYEVACTRMVELLLADPLMRRYENYLEYGPRPHPNTEWWHALGHQRLATVDFLLALTRKEIEDPKNRVQTHVHPTVWDARVFPTDSKGPMRIGPSEASWEWAGRVADAETYLWHQDTLEAAVAAPLPEHVVQPNALPFDNVFFSFEMAAWVEESEPAVVMNTGINHRAHPVQIGGHDGPGHDDPPVSITARSETWWCLISKFADAGMVLCFDKQIWPPAGYQSQTHIIVEPVTWGDRWPDDFKGRRFEEQIGAVLRMLAFMQAPFVDATKSSRRLPRPIRREYDRAHTPAPDQQVSVVTLRRALNEPVYRNGDSPESSREYTHSWWVSGHYRWQYYPSEKAHRLIAIAAFIKQAGKPMLKKLYDVKQ